MGKRSTGKPRGRPTILNAALQAEIVKSLEDGAHLETAAEAAGVHLSTLYLWLDKGIGGQQPYADFVEGVTRARAKAELEMLRDVRNGAGDKHGHKARGAAWVLERTRPHRYAQRINMRVEDAVRQVLEVFRGVCTAEDFERGCARLEALDREGGEGLPGADPGGQAARDPSSVH